MIGISNVQIKWSDPWDLGESFGWQPLRAKIIAERDDQHGGSILLKLEKPFVYKDTRCEYFVASPRHEASEVGEIAVGRPVFCALTQVPQDRIDAEDPFDLSWWRGGIAGLAEIMAEQSVTGE
ncbi:MAG: hypothetical protein Q8R92_10885 [Deltaproteobacteria bacterium]|nr:hypothetical protein [Deltaproteobacteria bacterium]